MGEWTAELAFMGNVRWGIFLQDQSAVKESMSGVRRMSCAYMSRRKCIVFSIFTPFSFNFIKVSPNSFMPSCIQLPYDHNLIYC